jgi:hypothetical protein
MLLALLYVVFPSQVFAAEELCRVQTAQEFLLRRTTVNDAVARQRSIDYRTLEYGSSTSTDGGSAHSQTEETRFMGQSVRLHRRIIPAVACAEQRIRETCAGDVYAVERLSGVRTSNTYRGGEISNHLFGIALDIDPSRNPCCGCVEPWSQVPACRGWSRMTEARRLETVFERVRFTRCWVDAFERYGFYWLGWDRMEDTMHFEFLGKPEEIVVN